MLGYLDPNIFGLPVQTMAPWLAACLGAMATAFLFGWRCTLRPLMVAGRMAWRRRGMRIAMGAAILGSIAIAIFVLWKPSAEAEAVSEPSGKEGDILVRSSAAKTDRLLILGMDGLDPDILAAMIDAGDLPHFSELAKGGVFRPLETVTPPESPVVWSSFATGVGPEGHGIFDFIRRNPSDYGLDLSFSLRHPDAGYVNARDGRPFWQELSSSGVPVRVLFAPCSFPPETVNGVLLAGMGTPDMRGSLGRYTLISSDPTWAERSLSGDLIGVSGTTRRVIFDLPGPRLAGGGLLGGRPRDLAIPVELVREEGLKAVTLSIDGQTVHLTVGQWGPWVELSFSRRFGKALRGMCRFYLSSVEPDLNLYCTALHFSPTEPVFPITHPAGYARELAEKVGLFGTLGMPLDTKAYEDGVLDAAGFLSMAEWLTSENERVLLHEMDRWDRGMLFCYFNAPDPVQHMFWTDFLKTRLSEQGSSSLPKPIRNIYRKMDTILGEAMDRVGRQADTQVMVVSDHGFADFRRSVDVNRILMDLGHLRLRPNHVTSEAMFAAVDWANTEAYACGFSSVFINLQGREGHGIVAPERRAELVDRMSQQLLAYVDADTQEHPFSRVTKCESTSDGPHGSRSPDLIVGCAPGYRVSWLAALGGAGGEAVVPNAKRWRGDHIMDAEHVPGILVMRRPDDRSPESITDVGRYVLEAMRSDGVPEMAEQRGGR